VPACINFVEIKGTRIDAAAAHPSERVIRATTVRLTKIFSKGARRAISRDSCTLRVLKKKRRQPDMKQMKCKLSGARHETLEIRSVEPERAVRE